MEIKSIEYHRKKNLGNYEIESFSLVAVLESGDIAQHKMEELRETVENVLFGNSQFQAEEEHTDLIF